MSEYPYQHNGTACTHAYLNKPIADFLLDAERNARVLDLGCGNGAILGTLRGRGLELHGIDSSESGISIAKSTHADIHFTVGDISEDLNAICPASSFDFVICTDVVEHLYNPRGLIRNSFHALKPGGWLLISTPYHGWLKNSLLAVTGKLDSHFTALWDHGHIKFWSRRTLSRLLQEGGFRNPEFVGTGRIPYVWKSMVLKAQRPRPNP